jgi:hypothetical protein
MPLALTDAIELHRTMGTARVGRRSYKLGVSLRHSPSRSMQRVSAVISILAAKEIRQQGAISASSQQLGECSLSI